MGFNQMETLTIRLDRLERENRWWKVLGVTAVSVLSLVVIIGATGNKVVDEVRARKLFILDKDGIVRAKLSVDDIGAGEDMVRLWLYDKRNKPGILLAVSSGGASVLSLKDGNDISTATLWVYATGESRLVFKTKGKVIWKAP